MKEKAPRFEVLTGMENARSAVKGSQPQAKDKPLAMEIDGIKDTSKILSITPILGCTQLPFSILSTAILPTMVAVGNRE